MKLSEIREMAAADIEAKAGELKQELFNLRFQKATGQLENPMRIVKVKREIARLLTVARQKKG
ncbi:MAG: 50S ribosomal protein L29 [Thermodesulfobacteriota bacterium]